MADYGLKTGKPLFVPSVAAFGCFERSFDLHLVVVLEVHLEEGGRLEEDKSQVDLMVLRFSSWTAAIA